MITLPASADPLLDPLILAPPPLFTPDRVREVLARAYGLTGELTPLGGERDRNFRLVPAAGEALLVKFAHPDEDPEVTAFQTAALLHLEAADPGLPVPRVRRARDGATTVPHPTDQGRPSLLRVLTFVPGQPMTGGDGPGLAGVRELGALTARLDRALEPFSHPAETRRLLWDIREAPNLRALLPEVADPALRALAASVLDRYEVEAAPVLGNLPAQVIHNDLNPHNVLAAPDDPSRPSGIIDFGDMVRATRLQEVATACAYVLRPGGNPLAAPAAFLSGYRGVLPLPSEEAVLLPVLIATRMALTVLIASWRARRQPENAAYILRNMPGAHAGLERLAQRSAQVLPSDEGERR